MFKNPKRQGVFLTNLFSFIFSSLESQDKFRRVLEELAISHCQKGIKSCEYGIIGEVMFWTLKIVLKSEYSSKVHIAWVKIFSSMLNIILPIAISHELRSNRAQLQRISKFEGKNVDADIQSVNSDQCSIAGPATMDDEINSIIDGSVISER